MEHSKSQPTDQLLCVKDTKGILTIVLMIAVFGGLTCIMFFVFLSQLFNPKPDQSASGYFWMSVFFSLIAYMSLLAFKTENKGFIIDLANDSFTFPGGKVADEVSDYLKLSWWAQRIGLKRSEVKLSQITSISSTDPKVWNKATSKFDVSHLIACTGAFGAITNSFESEDKRDQLYSLLSQTLEAGEAVVIR